MPNKDHPLTWVVVADNCQAKIFRMVKFPKIEEIATLEHPESRLHNQDLSSSEPGRGFQRGGVTRHAYQQKTEPKQVEAIKFATDLANFLSSKENQGQFNRLYIIAEPSFLGLLRQHIKPQIKKIIVAELAMELTTSNVATIEKHLSEM